MRIILVRHGETTQNAEKRLSGNTNVAKLTKIGLEHAERLKEIFKDHKIDAIFSSPLERAMNTIKPLAESLGIEVQPKEELREFDFGTLDGKEEYGEAEEASLKRRKDLDFRFPEGDSYNDVLKRVGKFLNELTKESHKMIIIQGHGGVNRCVLSILMNSDHKNLDTINTSNSLVYEFDTETKELWWQDTLSKEKGSGLLSREGV